MRSLSPVAIWFVAVPLVTATQFHGCGLDHRADWLLGQAVPLFGVYCGPQPLATSSLRLEMAGSQSIVPGWFESPVRSVTSGSLTDRAFSSVPWIASFTTRGEVQDVLPLSHSCRLFAAAP